MGSRPHRKSVYRVCLWAVLWLIGHVPASAQSSWTRRQYTSESGLLQNRLHAMERDAWGALIIGTEGGLVRFDGERFRQIGIPAPEGMRPSRVIDMISSAEGGFVVRDAGCRQYLYADDKLVSITGEAPARRPTSRFSGVGVSVELIVKAMDPDSTMAGKSDWAYSVRSVPLDDRRWCMRTESELLVYEDSLLMRRIPVPNGRWSHLVKVAGAPYVVDVTGTGYRIDVDNGRVERVVMQGFPAPEIKQGQLNWRMFWGTLDGIVTVVAGDSMYVVEALPGSTGLMARNLGLELPTDCRIGGAVWLEPGNVMALGTDTKGLFIYHRNVMRSHLCDVVLEGVNNAYMAQAPFGTGGVITSTRGTARVFSAAGCAPGPAPIRGFDEVAIVLDRGQRYWYGREDSLFVYDTVLGEERLVREGIRPLCFLQEPQALWVGSVKGIHRIAGDQITLVHPLNEKDLSFRPTSLARTADGELWMATCSGVYRAGGAGGWEVVPGLAGVCARALKVVDEGVLIGTYGSGVYLFKDGAARQLPQDEQGFLSHVHAFMPDSAGFLWMSTNQGLFRMRRADLGIWAADTEQHIYYAYYGKQSGILNPEFNGGCDPPYVRTTDGWASFPTMDGLVWFRPEELPDAYPVNRIVPERLEVDGRAMPIAGSMELPWGHGDVVMRFSLAYWGDQENARIEYSVAEGDALRWVQLPAGGREVRLSNLPPGEPILRLRKVGAAARGEGDAVTIRFIVRPPFFRRAWFIATCVIGGVLLFLLALRINAARLRRKNLQLEQKVRERTSELMTANAVLRRSLEMKEMLVSIISHDIVTPLRFIARVSNGAARSVRPEEQQRLSDTLSDLASASVKLHANAQDLLHWIKRQDGRIELRERDVALHGLAQEVIDRERERAIDKGIELVNSVGLEDAVRTDRNVLSIVLHNLIANAVTHTVEGRVEVRGGAVDGAYELEVLDTGPGMTEAALRHAERVQRKGALGAMNDEGERDVQGLGLLIVADLLQLLGGSFAVRSSLEAGTSIRLRLPIALERERMRSRATPRHGGDVSVL